MRPLVAVDIPEHCLPNISTWTTLWGPIMTQPLSGQVVLSSIIEGVDTTGTVATFTDTNLGDTAGDFTAGATGRRRSAR